MADDFDFGTVAKTIGNGVVKGVSDAGTIVASLGTSAINSVSNVFSNATTTTSNIITKVPSIQAPTINASPATNSNGLTLPTTAYDPQLTEVLYPVQNKSTSTTIEDFAPNPMSSIDQPSYYWRFYLKEDIGSGTSEITIAETGVTGFNIQEVRFSGTIGPNFKTRNVNATEFSLRIAEPAGMSLPDMLMAAINQLKIRNYMKAPWYLDLQLRGRDPVTGEPGGLGKLTGARDKWTWKILITELVTNTTEVGGIHTIKAYPYNDVSALNQIAILDSNATIPGKTVGDILKKVIESMNQSVKEKYGFQMTTYDIKDIPYKEAMGDIKNPFDHKIEPEKIPENSERNREGASLARGTDISKIVDYLMGQSPTAVKMANPSREFEYKGNHKAEPSTIHRVAATVEVTGYDWVINDYIRKVTFTIVPYEMLRIAATPEQIMELNESGGTGSVIDNKYKVAIERKYLNKIYEYLWTGRNTEVLKFDINLNFKFAVPFSPSLGIFHYGSATVGRELVERLRTNMKNLEVTKNQLDQIQNARSSNSTNSSASMAFRGVTPSRTNSGSATAAEAIASSTTTARSANAAEQQQTVGTNPDDYIKDENYAKLELQAQKDRNTLISAINKDRISFNQIAEEQRGTVKLQGNTYAEDLDLSAPIAKNPQPLTMLADSNNPRVNQEQGTESHNNTSKSVYATILNQVYTNVADGNLQSIQLEIRGDPYWIGPSNTENITTTTSSQVANFLSGEHLFGLKFGLPSGFTEYQDAKNNQSNGSNQGVRPTNEIYSGYYGVVKVENIFSDGVFKQTLHAQRLPAWKFREAAKKTQ